MESSLCADMAQFAVACTLGSSRWNSAPGRQACVLRLLEVKEYKFPFNIDKVGSRPGSSSTVRSCFSSRFLPRYFVVALCSKLRQSSLCW